MQYLKSAPDALVRLHRESVSTVEEAAARMLRETIDRCRAILTEPQSEAPNPGRVEIPWIISTESRALLGRLLSDTRMNAFWRKFNSLIACERGNRCWSLKNNGILYQSINLWTEIDSVLTDSVQYGPESNAKSNAHRRDEFLDISERIVELNEKLKQSEMNMPFACFVPGGGVFEKETRQFIENGKPLTRIADFLEMLSVIAKSKSNENCILPHPKRKSAKTIFFIRKIKEYFDFWLPDMPVASLRTLAWVTLDLPEEPSESGTRELLQKQTDRQKNNEK